MELTYKDVIGKTMKFKKGDNMPAYMATGERAEFGSDCLVKFEVDEVQIICDLKANESCLIFVGATQHCPRISIFNKASLKPIVFGET